MSNQLLVVQEITELHVSDEGRVTVVVEPPKSANVVVISELPGPRGFPGISRWLVEDNGVYPDRPDPVDEAVVYTGVTNPSALMIDGDVWINQGVEEEFGPYTGLEEFREATDETNLAVQSGRLSEDALGFQFRQDRIVIPANQMMSASGTPGLIAKGGYWPGWNLDANTAEGVSFGFAVPRHWATFDVWVRGVNTAAVAGGVALRSLHAIKGDGDDVTVGFTNYDATLAAVASTNVRQSIKVGAGLSADSTKGNVIRIQRQATSTADTLPNDWAVTSVELVAASYVSYVPPAIEEPDLSGAQAVGGLYFTKASNDPLPSLGIRVFQQAPPPASDSVDETYSYWPVTDVSTSQNFSTSTWTGGNKWSFLWANRRNYDDAWNKKPNPFPAPTIKTGTQECRATFTTIDRANAATQCQIRYMLGRSAADYQAPWIAVGGVAGDFITDAQMRANPGNYCTTDFQNGTVTYKVTVDRVYLPAPRFVDGTHPELQLGVVLDYEVQDSRTPANTLAFLQALAADLHADGRQLYIYTNPLNAPTEKYTGLDNTNLPAVLAAVDFLSIFAWSKSVEGSVAASYAAQIALLGALSAAAWDKLVITFELGTSPGTTLADAQWVRSKMREAGTTHPNKVMFWRNYAVQGAAATTLTNQKIAAIVEP